MALIPALAALGLGSVPAAAAVGGVTFGGFTGQGWPVVFKLSKDGKQVAHARIGLDLTCQSGTPISSQPDDYGRLRIRKSGAFHASFANLLVDLGQGRTGVFSGDITGKLNARRTRITGTWHLHLVVRDNQGNPIDQCDSSIVRFTALQ